jgi:hypothetical protein
MIQDKRLDCNKKYGLIIGMNILPAAGRESYGCFKPSRSKKYYKEAVKLYPESPETPLNLGHLYYHKQEQELAEEEL